MQLDIRDLHRRLGLTIVFVTHDQSEALTMSDRIAVFNRGKIEQIGSPEEIYDRPHTRFVADFVGETNLVEATVETTGSSEATVVLASGKRLTTSTGMALEPRQKVMLSIRPERIRLGDAGAANSFSGRIVDCVYHGDHLRVMLDEAAGGLVVKADRSGRAWAPGDEVAVSFTPADCWVVG
jgi:putative spermidine/putrescine transport system ATP-binding protein